MESEDKRAEALAWMGKLTVKEFVELFYEAADNVKMWNFEDEEEARRYADIQEYLVLARVEKDEKVDEVEYFTQFIGLPDAEEYHNGTPRDFNLTEDGKCECGNQIKSWVKRAICPVCGKKVSLT